MGVTEDIVRFVDETRFDALPDEVVFRTKTLIADAIGTILAGSSEDGSRILQKYLKQSGGREQAPVIPAGSKGLRLRRGACQRRRRPCARFRQHPAFFLAGNRSWHPHP